MIEKELRLLESELECAALAFGVDAMAICNFRIRVSNRG